ncbi:hypothetical protein LCGC14_0579480 [marine sediment metagenome]|uniref:Ribbon-helix-helix protein CopG domain-containing protein n=1 Tax=marine sediment metagenome TaxID=412755 RepID=A0A0F9UQ38_9ZZZZ
MLDRTYIKTTGISVKLKDLLKTIAKNKGITLSALVRPALRELCESQPEYLKKNEI